MKIRSLIAATIVAASSLAVAPVPGASCYVLNDRGTPDPEDDVVACRADAWFHGNSTRVGNTAGLGYDELPSWDATAPTASYQSGAGAGYVADFAADCTGLSELDPAFVPTFAGTFTGNIDSVAMKAYLIAPVDHYVWGEYGFRIAVDIDGTRVYESDFLEGDSATLVESGDGIGYIEVAVRSIYKAAPGLATGPDTDHDVLISLSPYCTDDEALMVYDAVEVPSGLIFNADPGTLATYLQLEAQ